jgi:hypothetical protein
MEKNMLNIEEAVGRLSSLNSDPANALSMILLDEQVAADYLKTTYPEMSYHFMELSKLDTNFTDLLNEQNVFDNLFEVLPAHMALDPTIGFQLVKDIFKELGFESRDQYTKWMKLNPNSYLNLLRSSITFIQAYFDLNCIYGVSKYESNVIEFISKAFQGNLSEEEQKAVENSNNLVNEYLWNEESQIQKQDAVKNTILFGPMTRYLSSYSPHSIEKALPNISKNIIEIGEIESIRKGEDLGKTLLKISEFIAEFSTSSSFLANQELVEKYEHDIFRLDAHIAYNALAMKVGYAVNWQDAVQMILEYLKSKQFEKISTELLPRTQEGRLGIDFVQNVISKIID